MDTTEPSYETGRDRMTRGFPRWAVILCVIAAVGLGIFPGSLSGYLIGSTLWWDTKSTAECALVDYHYRATPDGVVYDVDTENCGPLQVTSGPALTMAQATALGDSLRSGEKYRLTLRGWAGWPNVPRAIVDVDGFIATKHGLNP